VHPFRKQTIATCCQGRSGYDRHDPTSQSRSNRQGKTEIRIGIGIASGQVIAGYTGTIRRATYTCVGDTVNLAARLESHTKVVGKPILIDGTTHDALISKIKTDSEGSYQLKGKTVEVPVYSVPVDQKVK
jgi:class 3 adenylate cyclase